MVTALTSKFGPTKHLTAYQTIISHVHYNEKELRKLAADFRWTSFSVKLSFIIKPNSLEGSL